MKDICFVSVVFGDKRYIDQQDRLLKSIDSIYPMTEEVQYLFWTNTLPPGAKHHRESLYGFKVYAVLEALHQGFKKIVWMDSACILQDKLDYYFEIIKDYGVIAAKDDNLLKNHISDKALEYFGNPDTKGMHLIGGSLYIFNFSSMLCSDIFDQWKRAEADGIFGSQYESATGQINRSRHDESALAMSLYLNDSEPVPYDVCRYNNGPGSIVNKLHFK